MSETVAPFKLERHRIVIATAQAMISNAALISNENWFRACHEIGQAEIGGNFFRYLDDEGVSINTKVGMGRLRRCGYTGALECKGAAKWV